MSNKINNFEEYGFTGDFEGEILKEVKGWYIGWIQRDGVPISQRWDNNGLSQIGVHFNLTPIKKQWYEDKNKFPCAIISSKGRVEIAFAYSEKSRNIFYGPYECIDGVRPATKEEILTLLVKE